MALFSKCLLGENKDEQSGREDNDSGAAQPEHAAAVVASHFVLPSNSRLRPVELGLAGNLSRVLKSMGLCLKACCALVRPGSSATAAEEKAATQATNSESSSGTKAMRESGSAPQYSSVTCGNPMHLDGIL